MALPDFIIIGAMKCGTSTLAAQLAAQDGVFVTTPKEPNFFSDEDVFAKGMGWYETLFEGAAPGDLKGEASTHYTKLPTYPAAAARAHAAAPGARLIYLMREPVGRAISHYVHEWTQGIAGDDLDHAIDALPEMTAYSRYDEQLAPWRALYGSDAILCLRLEDMKADPQGTLERVAVHLGRPGAFRWVEDMAPQNVSAERIRRFPGYAALVESAPATWLRRNLIPQALRDLIKGRLQMRERPEPTAANRARLAEETVSGKAEWQAATAPAAAAGDQGGGAA
jgi:hypothetical protein